MTLRRSGSGLDIDSQKRVADLTEQMRQLMADEEQHSDESDDNNTAEEFWESNICKPDLINIEDAEKKILEKQLQQTVANLGDTKDDLHFAEHKLREAESRNKTLITQLLSERDRTNSYNKQALTGAQKFMFQKNLMLQRRALNKKHNKAVEELHERIESQEQSLMFSHDTLLNPLPESMNSAPPAGPHEYMRESESFKEQQYIEVHKAVDTSADDEYADIKATQSLFESQLTKLRKDIRPVMKDFKDSTDNSLINIERILWPPVGRHPRPKDAFSRAAKAQMAKSKMLLADGYRRLNNAVLSFVAEEKTVKDSWTRSYQDTVSKCDVEIQTDIQTGPTEEELRLQSDLDMIKDRMKKMREQSIKKERTVQTALDRVKLNLQYIQEKATELHKEMYTALHACFKHRFRWIDRHVDHFRDASQQKDLRRNPQEVKYNLSLGLVVSKDIEQLKRFTEYFTRDDFFGLDMTSKDAPIPGCPPSSITWKPGGRKNVKRKSSMSSLTRAAGSEKDLEHSPSPPRKMTAPVCSDSGVLSHAELSMNSNLQILGINEVTSSSTLPIVPPIAPPKIHGSSPRKRHEVIDNEQTFDIRHVNRRRSAAITQEEIALVGSGNINSRRPSIGGDSLCTVESIQTAPMVTSVKQIEERRSSIVPRLELKGCNRSVSSEHRQSPHPPGAGNSGRSPSPRSGRPPRSAGGSGRTRSQRHLIASKSTIAEPQTQTAEDVAKAVSSLLTYPIKNMTGWCSPPKHSVVTQPDGTHTLSSGR